MDVVFLPYISCVVSSVVDFEVEVEEEDDEILLLLS